MHQRTPHLVSHLAMTPWVQVRVTLARLVELQQLDPESAVLKLHLSHE